MKAGVGQSCVSDSVDLLVRLKMNNTLVAADDWEK